MPSKAYLMLRAPAGRVSKHARHRCSPAFGIASNFLTASSAGAGTGPPLQPARHGAAAYHSAIFCGDKKLTKPYPEGGAPR